MPTAWDLLIAGTQLPITGTYTTAEHLATFMSSVSGECIGDVVVEEKETHEIVIEEITTEIVIDTAPVEIMIEPVVEDIVVDPDPDEIAIDPLC